MAYRYQNPRSQQYQSTFVPLPLDYLNQALQSRQQAYDQNMQNIMQAEDKYAGIETAPAWTEEKNRLMDETFNTIHKTVQDKYGGDYSQATNEIMRGVVGLRKNSFWNMANQDLLDWKQKKALKDQLEATGQLEYAEGFENNTPIKDEKGNYILPKRQVYAKVDTDRMLQTDFAGRFNTTRDVNVPTDRYGQYKTKRVTGSTRGEMNDVITPQYAQEILRTNPQLVMSHPEYKNPEIFRQKLVNDAMGRMPENEVYNYDRNLGVLTAGELMQERRYQADDETNRLKAAAAAKKAGLDNIWTQTGTAAYKDKTVQEIKDAGLSEFFDTDVQKLSKENGLNVSSYDNLLKLKADTIIERNKNVNPSPTGEHGGTDSFTKTLDKIKTIEDKLDMSSKVSLLTKANSYRLQTNSIDPALHDKVRSLNKDLAIQFDSDREYFTSEFKNKPLEKAMKDINSEFVGFDDIVLDSKRNDIRMTVKLKGSDSKLIEGRVKLSASAGNAYENMLELFSQAGPEPRQQYINFMAPRYATKFDEINADARYKNLTEDQKAQAISEGMNPDYGSLYKAYMDSKKSKK